MAGRRPRRRAMLGCCLAFASAAALAAGASGPRHRRRVVLGCCLAAAALAGLSSVFARPVASSPARSSSGQAGTRYVLVTGSTRGIGFELARLLLQESTAGRPLAVIVTGRTQDACAAACEKLIHGAPGATVHAIPLDVADAASRGFAIQKLREIVGEAGTLSALVNNAGVALDLPWSPPPPPGGDAEIAERTLGTNFLGPLALTQGLIEAGLLGRGSRVINVSSGGGHIAIHKILPEHKEFFLSETLSSEDVAAAARRFVSDARVGGKPELEKKWGYSHNYGFSKLCLTTSTRTLAKEHPQLLVHGCTPGFILTDMTAGSSATGTPEQGAQVIKHLVTSEESRLMRSGGFFNKELELMAWDDPSYMPKPPAPAPPPEK